MTKRTFTMAVDNAFGHVAIISLPLVAYFNRTWTNMHIWAGIVCAIAIPTTYFMAPESSRWLIANNRGSKAEAILADIAKGNGKTLTEEEWEDIRQVLKEMGDEKSSLSSTTKLNILDMFRRSHLQRTLILIFNWVGAIVTGYALVLNMNDLAGDIFANFIVTMLVELPGVLMSYYLMDKIGNEL